MSTETIFDPESFGLRASLDACVKCTICETQCPVARSGSITMRESRP